MARGRLIALVGIDGAGKSHQAARLAVDLRRQGVRARAFENPGGRPVLDALARALGRDDGAALIGRRARTAVEITIRGAAIARAVLWARITGGTAILDRYAVCQIATARARDEPERGGEWLRRVAPRPAATLWLRVAPATAQHRIAARGTAEESIEWLTAFDAAYHALTEAADLTPIVAAGDPDEVARCIRSALVTVLVGTDQVSVRG